MFQSFTLLVGFQDKLVAEHPPKGKIGGVFLAL